MRSEGNDKGGVSPMRLNGQMTHGLHFCNQGVPSFIHVSDGKLHDVHALDLLTPEAGAIYVMDRGYVDFARLCRLHLAGAFFVTRAKSNLKAHLATLSGRRWRNSVTHGPGSLAWVSTDRAPWISNVRR